MYKWLCMAAILGLSGCQYHHVAPSTLVDQGDFMLLTANKSKAVNQRIRFLVLHYTAADFPTSLALLTGDKVSAHYFIPAIPAVYPDSGKPVVWQLVPETLRAWHAGVSSWGKSTNLNDSSVGIEQENEGFTETVSGVRWYPYTSAQIDLVVALAKQIVQRYQIEAVNIVGHSDIAPLRKMDPGPLFPWKTLADAGIGAWPNANTVTTLLAARAKDQPVAIAPLLAKLARYGYGVTPEMTPEEQRRVIAAFQMHFRPADIRGKPDAETAAIIDALLVKYY